MFVSKCSSGRCIPHAFVCDKKKDCPDGEEEDICHDVVQPVVDKYMHDKV